MALDYAEQHLASWPDELRAAPIGWKTKVGGDALRRWRLIRTLHRAACHLTDEDIATLITAASAHLTHLQLDRNLITDVGVQHIAASPHLGRLQHLSLCSNKLSNSGFIQLMTSPHLPSLQTLRLADNGINERGLEALAHAHPDPGLTRLDLGGTWLGDVGARWLAAMAWPRGLRELGLYGARLSHEGVRLMLRAFAAEPWPLEALDLSYNPRLGDRGLRELALCRTLPTLSALRLRRCEISSEGVAALIEHNPPWLAGLRHLDLSDNHIGDQGAALLANSTPLPTGAVVDLSLNRLSEAGLRAVEASPEATRVRFITQGSRVWGTLLD